MRVLLVHNRYRRRAGEDTVYDAESAMLESRGHDVFRVEVDSRSIPDSQSLREKVQLGAGVTWSKKGRAKVESAVRGFGPDIAHFHNTFPLISPAAYSVCKRAGVPVVQHIPNYRLICPKADLFRQGRICTECTETVVPWPSIRYGCRNDSRAESAAVAAMITAHGWRGTWRRDVDRYVAPSKITRQLLVSGGLPADKVVVKPNFVDPDPGHSPGLGSGFLFVGRLAPGKGIETLLRACDQLLDVPLLIVGDGPLRGLVEEASAVNPQIRQLGWLPQSEVYDMMRRSYALIVPSEWHEPFGMMIVEAFAIGRPVIGSNAGAIPEIVDHRANGLLTSPGDPADLASAVRWAIDHHQKMEEMGVAARAKYESYYTADQNYPQLLEIYEGVLNDALSRTVE